MSKVSQFSLMILSLSIKSFDLIQLLSYIFLHQISCSNNFNMQILFKESKEFLRAQKQFPQQSPPKGISVQKGLLQFILNHSQKGNPTDVINKIDDYCSKHWMMNLGPQKADVVKKMGFNKNIRKVLEIGGYCGYSALVFANQLRNLENSQVYTIQINKNFAQIAHQIHQHAGLADRIHINVGTVQTSLNFIKQKSPFDLIFIDHVKTLYLSDFKLLEQIGSIKKGTVVVGDNIIYPGAPEYLTHFKNSIQYESTLFHSYLEYSNQPDAVLISTKL